LIYRTWNKTIITSCIKLREIRCPNLLTFLLHFVNILWSRSYKIKLIFIIILYGQWIWGIRISADEVIILLWFVTKRFFWEFLNYCLSFLLSFFLIYIVRFLLFILKILNLLYNINRLISVNFLVLFQQSIHYTWFLFHQDRFILLFLKFFSFFLFFKISLQFLLDNLIHCKTF